MRATTWRYLRGDAAGTQLIAIAREIALGDSPPPPINGGHSAINYLTNGEMPEIAPHGLSSLLPGGFELNGFTGLNFTRLEPLADAKTVGVLSRSVSPFRLCGFKTGGLAGLSILFGGWSDFCLWCWAKHPAGPSIKPTVILSSDNGPLAGPPATCRPVKAGADWGFEEASDVRGFWNPNLDPSTRRLFREIAVKAYGKPADLDAAQAANPGYLGTFEEYVGTKRIFAFNVWPWFRVGTAAVGNNIHNFNGLPQIEGIVKELVDALAPESVITLGGWAGAQNMSAQTPEVWLQRACQNVRNLYPCYHPSSAEWTNDPLGAKGVFSHLP